MSGIVKERPGKAPSQRSPAPEPAILTFLGGVGTVTGSKYFIEIAGQRVLVDCGLFQGLKQLRLRNWERLPISAASLDAVVLTHAHLDHSGYLPLLVKQGFAGKVLCTEATRDLCGLLLPDSGYLQERDADYANRHGFSKHKPALPLYTQQDATAAAERLVGVAFERDRSISGAVSVRFLPAGHILGAAIVEISAGGKKIVFSGDLGRPNSPTMVDPTPVQDADYLIVESTYGNRKHASGDPEQILAEIIVKTAARGGTVLIPSFAVGRAQTLLFHLSRLKAAHRIPELPIYLDSPMASSAGNIFCAHLGKHALNEAECRAVCEVAHYIQSAEESKALNGNPMPKVIVSASGMATGGRVLHHLKWAAPEPRNTILFAGFQAAGTRGQAMVSGAATVKIHGREIPIRAEVQNLEMLSAHADADEIMAWLKNFRQPPRRTFVTHGEPAASAALRDRIEAELGWACCVPTLGEGVLLA